MKKYFEKIYKETASSFYKKMEDSLIKNKKEFIITANPETLMFGKIDSDFNKVLLDPNTTIIPDGIGVVKGAKRLGIEISERIPGIELVQELFIYANKHNKSLYIFGAKEEIISKLANKIKEEYPNIELLGYENGYVADKNKAFEVIEDFKPDIVLVALGIPVQEKLIYNNLKNFGKGIFVGVGGSFDVLSGEKKRAPKLFIKLNLEWLYRLIKEPKRIKRFYISNVKFIKEIKNEKN